MPLFGDDMNTSPDSFDRNFFTFLTSDSNEASGSNGQVSVWINGPTSALDLLTVYEIHKEECCHHIDEASSFVLYDTESNRIVAVRDFFGTYPLYYAEIDNGLVFSFSVKNIAEFSRFTPMVNPVMLADYLNWDSCTKPITNQTFYQHLYTLLPAHKLVSEKGQVTIKPYGQLRLEKYASFTDGEYLQHFNDFFVAAVQKTVSPYHKIATHLSGGLDSSSVSSVAQSLATQPVHSFYIHTDTPAAQEEEYVEALLEKWDQEGRPIVHQNIQPQKDIYSAVVKTTAQLGQPSQLLLPINTFLPIMEQAQQAGCDILLSGHCGDQVLGYGFEYMDQLFQKRDWKTLKTAIDQYADKRSLVSLAPKESFKTASEKRRSYAVYFFARKLRHTKSINTWAQALTVLLTQFDCGIRDLSNFFKARKKQRKEAPIPTVKEWLREDWAQPKSTSTRRELDSTQLVIGTPSASQKEQIDFFFISLGIQYNEEIGQLHACYSLQTAHPFLDKNLLELTLNTPARLRFGEGLGRSVLRQGLADYLPEKITNRVDKGEFSEYAHHAFIDLYNEFTKQADLNNPIWEIVDKKTFDEAVHIIFDEKYTIKQKNPYRFVASRVIYLAIWLNYLKMRSA